MPADFHFIRPEWLLAFGGIVAAVALAGPAWQRIEQPVFRADQALVIALDLSRSMDAEDIQPSRLARAKLKILGILDRREGGQTALLVYTANAYTVTPLTNDTDTVAALVNSLSTDIMPSRGSYPEVGIRRAQPRRPAICVTPATCCRCWVSVRARARRYRACPAGS